MIHEWYLIVLPVIFVGSVFATIGGGGLGIVLVFAFSFFTDIRTSVVVISLIGFAIQPAKILHFYRYARWDIIRWYAPIGVFMSVIGGTILFSLPLRFVEIFMGTLCVGFVILQSSHMRISIQPRPKTLLLLGAINGIIGGMIGEGTLIRSPALLAMGIRKEVFIGTSSMIGLFMNIGKTSAYLPNIDWSRELIFLLACAIPLTFAGVWIGKRCLKYVSGDVFEKILLYVILAGAIKLLIYP